MEIRKNDLYPDSLLKIPKLWLETNFPARLSMMTYAWSHILRGHSTTYKQMAIYDRHNLFLNHMYIILVNVMIMFS